MTATHSFAISWDASSVTGEQGWRVQRSLDGRTFDTTFSITGDLTGTATYSDDYSSLPEGTRVY